MAANKIRFANAIGDVFTVNIDDVELEKICLPETGEDEDDEFEYKIRWGNHEEDISELTYDAITRSIEKITAFMETEIPSDESVLDIVTKCIMDVFPNPDSMTKILSDTMFETKKAEILKEVRRIFSLDCFNIDYADPDSVDGPIHAMTTVWDSYKALKESKTSANSDIVKASTPNVNSFPKGNQESNAIPVNKVKATTVEIGSAAPTSGIPRKL